MTRFIVVGMCAGVIAMPCWAQSENAGSDAPVAPIAGPQDPGKPVLVPGEVLVELPDEVAPRADPQDPGKPVLVPGEVLVELPNEVAPIAGPQDPGKPVLVPGEVLVELPDEALSNPKTPAAPGRKQELPKLEGVDRR